ncbi:YmfL family putative regulatory protein [Herbaspirillum sp.]|uniref:YmfL family putative regulatory protein n=1 Tax=Herbaspirillum sp. TaxID=1890675 RepID=UPI002584BDCA|nr:YmfL family putative regulatory protein [Herbaspirillum sp.]
MNLRQAHQGMIDAFPGGWDAMAAALGMTRDALSNRVYERKGQAVRTQHSLEMQAFTNTTLFAEAIAASSGGVFVKLITPGSVDREDLHSKFQELWARLGELSRAYTEYTDDNHIDAREKADLQRISNEIQRTMQELMALMFQIYCSHEQESVSGA